MFTYVYNLNQSSHPKTHTYVYLKVCLSIWLSRRSWPQFSIFSRNIDKDVNRVTEHFIAIFFGVGGRSIALIWSHELDWNIKYLEYRLPPCKNITSHVKLQSFKSSLVLKDQTGLVYFRKVTCRIHSFFGEAAAGFIKFCAGTHDRTLVVI